MRYTNYRKHPRVYEKKTAEQPESDNRILDLSAKAAVGILALTFVKGLFWGYILKKALD